MADGSIPAFLTSADAAGKWRRSFTLLFPTLFSRFIQAVMLTQMMEFGMIAVNRITTGEISRRGFAKAAKVLQVTVEEVELAVASLTVLLGRAVHLHLQPPELLLFLSDAGFQEPAQGALADVLAQRHDELFGMVTLNAPSYCNFDWRLDVQVASRSVRQQASPRYLIALQTSEGVKHIEADYSILKEVCLQLEAALAESRTAHSRRFLRVLK